MKALLNIFIFFFITQSDCDENNSRTILATINKIEVISDSLEIIYCKDLSRFYKIVYDKKSAHINPNYHFEPSELYELNIFRYDTIRPREWLFETAWYNNCLVLENKRICQDDTIEGFFILNWMKKKEY